MSLDEAGKTVREVVDNQMLAGTEAEIRRAGVSVRENRLERLPASIYVVQAIGPCSDCGHPTLLAITGAARVYGFP